MRSNIITTLLIQTLLAVIVGFIVSVVANLFVEGALFFLSLQTATTAFSIKMGSFDINLIPAMAMLISATLIVLVRRYLGVTKWSGPADSIYALHQQNVGVDIRTGIGSTMAAFVSASGGASVCLLYTSDAADE